MHLICGNAALIFRVSGFGRGLTSAEFVFEPSFGVSFFFQIRVRIGLRV